LIGLVEAIEDVRQMFGGNADAVIRDRDHHTVILTPRIEADDSTGRRVSQGISGQILQRLFKAMRIADHADILMRLGDDLDLFLLRRLRVTLRNALKQFVNVNVLLRQ